MTGGASEQVRFGPDRAALAAVVVLFFGTLPLATTAVWLLPLLLVPVACLVWLLRARVVTAPVGIEVCNGVRVRRWTWPQVEAFDVPRRGPVRLRTTDGKRVALTALQRSDLPRLLEQGR